MACLLGLLMKKKRRCNRMLNQAKPIIIRQLFISIVCLLMMTACAPSRVSNPVDPYEGFNRRVYHFNVALDHLIYRPAAKVYHTVLPEPVHQGVRHFFSNLSELTNVANDALQGNLCWAVSDMWRFIINSTVGLLGLLDIASPMGLEKHYQDFGLTLATWGVTQSPYIMLPFIGPSTLRDTVALPMDRLVFSSWAYIRDPHIFYGLYALGRVQLRSDFLQKDRLIYQAFDPYVFVRDAYLQQRAEYMKYSRTGKQDPEQEPT